MNGNTLFIELNNGVRMPALGLGVLRSTTEETPAAVETAIKTGYRLIDTAAAYLNEREVGEGIRRSGVNRAEPVDRRTDIWAFGVVLYEMLTGDKLFQGETITDVLASVVKEQPDLERVPAKLRPVLRACLQKDRKRRLQAIGDWRLLLGEEVGQPAPSRSRLGVGWIAAAVFAIAFAALSLVHFRETTPQPAVVRFQVPVPEGGTIVGGSMALSPDGRQLAIVARKANGARQLWVRALDSLETRPLAGTEGARLPFWSPDGRFLAFIDGDLSLKRIALSGGPAQTLCRLPDGVPTPGDWARDGVILVGGGDGLFRVPAAGGDPVRVTQADQAAGELTHAYPQVLPDGNHYLYLSMISSREKNAIYLGSWDGKLKKRLVTGPVNNFRYAPPVAPGTAGHLLFLREETLMAQPFDSKTLTIAREAFPVAELLGTGHYGAFTTSENGALAYYPRTGMATSSQLTWFDRSGKQSGNLGALGVYNNVALSRDGARAAVVQASESARMDIWLIDVARGIPTRFTFNDGGWDPTWSPDGSRLAYAARTSNLSSLAFKNSSGTEKEEQIPKTGRMERPCDWSPDGGSLMYTRLNPKTGIMGLWVLSGLGGDPANRKAAPYLETQFHTTQCQFSPDGRWVAYTSNEAAQGNEVNVQAYPAGPDKIRISNGGGSQPRWRRDGKELFYMAPGGKLMAVDVKTSPKFQALIPHLLFDSHMWFPEAGTRANDTTGSVFRYDVSPDGKRFLVNAGVQAESGATSPGITVVLNWAAGLNK
jgi:Tol biopolymer transport system component